MWQLRAHLSEESAVKLDDVGTVAAPHDHVQVHQQLLLLLFIHGRPNPLKKRERKQEYCFGLCLHEPRLSPRMSRTTLTAMMVLLGLCTILLTEPYAPRPISPRSFRSSAVKSQCCPGEIFSFPDDSMLCVLSLSLKETNNNNNNNKHKSNEPAESRLTCVGSETEARPCSERTSWRV